MEGGLGGTSQAASLSSGLSVKRRRDMRRQRHPSPGPPTKAYPQWYFEEAERSEGHRWQAGHGKLFCRQTTTLGPSIREGGCSP